MRPSELFVLALGLSMDACAVSICKGLSAGRAGPGNMLACGAYFGGFQAAMPLIGYLLGARFRDALAHADHWIAFFLLAVIGINMIREARSRDGDLEASFGPASMLPLAVATSVDALAVGVTFAFLKVAILAAVACIGAVTFLLCALGVKLGCAFGAKWKGRAELFGGSVLILMGAKILAEHLAG